MFFKFWGRWRVFDRVFILGHNARKKNYLICEESSLNFSVVCLGGNQIQEQLESESKMDYFSLILEAFSISQ